MSKFFKRFSQYFLSVVSTNNFNSYVPLGFPDFIMDPKQLDEKYKDLDISENQYFQNNVNANIYTLKQNLKQLGQPVNRTR